MNRGPCGDTGDRLFLGIIRILTILSRISQRSSGERQAIGSKVVLRVRRGRRFTLVFDGADDHVHLAEALPIVLRNDAGEAAQIVECEVGAGPWSLSAARWRCGARDAGSGTYTQVSSFFASLAGIIRRAFVAV